MFDIAFSELIVILLVALVVIGPERLPKVARTAGNFWGRMQRYVHKVKNDIANDMTVQETRQLQNSIKEEISDVERSLHEARLTIEQKVLQAQHGNPTDSADEQSPSAPPSSTRPSKPV